MKRQTKNPKGQSKQKEIKRKSMREPTRLKTRKGGLGKKLRQSKMSVELRDDLILPSGGTYAATLAQSHFRRKISQLNLLGFMIKIKRRSMHPLGLFYVCNTHGPQWFYSKILWPIPMEDVPSGKGKDPSRIGCILWNLRY